jgi:hypothetical protein
MVGRLLTRGKHLHGRIISLRREISAHIASFNPTTFCWSDSINQGSERSFICMPGVLSLSGHTFVCQGCWVWAVIHLYAWDVEFERSFICMPGVLSLSGHTFVCQECWVCLFRRFCFWSLELLRHCGNFSFSFYYWKRRFFSILYSGNASWALN